MMNPDGNKNTCRRAHRIITYTAGRIEQAEVHLEISIARHVMIDLSNYVSEGKRICKVGCV